MNQLVQECIILPVRSKIVLAVWEGREWGGRTSPSRRLRWILFVLLDSYFLAVVWRLSTTWGGGYWVK